MRLHRILLAAVVVPLSLGAQTVRKDQTTEQTAPPGPGPLRPYQVPTAQSFTLANGLKVVVVRQPALPIVNARVLVRAGAVYEPAEKSGLAQLTGNLVDQGVPGLTASQIAARMERLGAQFGTSAGYATAYVNVTALKNVFPEALALAARTLYEPTFPPSEFERIRSRMVTQTISRTSTVEGLASEAFARAVYQPDAPYARNAGGYKETLERLTLDDVKDWHRRTYAPSNATLLLVGDVSVDEARRLAEQSLGAWNGAPVELPAVANRARPAEGPRVILLDRPGSVQSGVYVGQAAMGYGDPAYFPMLALSEVLGGGFKARVNMNLREKHGWTYGAFANFAPRAGVGHLAVTSAVRTNATDSAVAEAVREYRRIGTEAVPEDELKSTLNNVVGSFPSSVQTVEGLTGRLETLLIYGLPLDFWSSYRERVSGVRPADIARVARERLAPEGLTIVVAGDLSKIEQPIRALNLGDVEVWDAAGKRVR